VTSFQLFDGSQGLVSVFSSYLIAAFEISGSYPIPIFMQKRVAERNFNDFILVKCQFPNVIGNVGKDKGIILNHKTIFKPRYAQAAPMTK
jgi:hypothetical protein